MRRLLYCLLAAFVFGSGLGLTQAPDGAAAASPSAKVPASEPLTRVGHAAVGSCPAPSTVVRVSIDRDVVEPGGAVRVRLVASNLGRPCQYFALQGRAPYFGDACGATAELTTLNAAAHLPAPIYPYSGSCAAGEYRQLGTGRQVVVTGEWVAPNVGSAHLFTGSTGVVLLDVDGSFRFNVTVESAHGCPPIESRYYLFENGSYSAPPTGEFTWVIPSGFGVEVCLRPAHGVRWGSVDIANQSGSTDALRRVSQTTTNGALVSVFSASGAFGRLELVGVPAIHDSARQPVWSVGLEVGTS